jgi:predicted  nucleic acid-binding Zn-ribbon protein
MPVSADNLRELHQLHQRARALRDRLASAPKTLAARLAALEGRKAALEAARKALQDDKVQQKKHEHMLQSHQSKIDDLKVKLNSVKKNEEYKAIQNQIALDQSHMSKTEGEVLEAMMRIDEKNAGLATLEAEFKTFAAGVEALKAQIEAQAGQQQLQLKELEVGIIEAENIISEDERDRYRRTVKQRGDDAMAAVENGACSGCYVAVTPQGINELMNGRTMTFCLTCGRILYLAEEEHNVTQRSGR